MNKKIYSIIFSLMIFSYFLLNKSNFPFKNTIPLFILLISTIYFNRDSKFKKNSPIYLLILACVLIIPNVITISQNIEYILVSPIFDGFIISIICFVLLNFYIYE